MKNLLSIILCLSATVLVITGNVTTGYVFLSVGIWAQEAER